MWVCVRACVRACVCLRETTEEKQSLIILEAGMSVAFFFFFFSSCFKHEHLFYEAVAFFSAFFLCFFFGLFCFLVSFFLFLLVLNMNTYFMKLDVSCFFFVLFFFLFSFFFFFSFYSCFKHEHLFMKCLRTIFPGSQSAIASAIPDFWRSSIQLNNSLFFNINQPQR